MSTPALGAIGDIVGRNRDLVFQHFTVDDGLPENSTRCILQDRSGFLWFGTQNGLVRYDGSRMLVFSPDENDSTAFGGRTVSALHEDVVGRLWIGTMLRGLWERDPDTGRFRPVDLRPPQAAESMAVTDIAESRGGMLWICTDQGVVSLDPRDGRVVWHPEITGADASLQLTTALVDGEGRVWCGAWAGGLRIYDPADGKVVALDADPADPRSLPPGGVNDIVAGPDGRIWLVSDTGLAQWQEATGDFRIFFPPAHPNPRAGMLICLAAGDDDLLWIGAADGLYAFSVDRGEFRFFGHDPQRPFSISSGPVLGLAVDSSQQLWVGTWLAGLDQVDLTAGWFRTWVFTEGDGSGQVLEVDAVAPARDGSLWVGTSDRRRGLGKGRVYRQREPDEPFEALDQWSPRGDELESVLSMAEDDSGTIWVGSFRGLWQVDGDRVVPADLGSEPAALALGSARIHDLAVAPDGRLWIAAAGGLYLVDSEAHSVRRYRYEPPGASLEGVNNMVSVHVDRASRVWVGTDAQGLYLFRGEREGFTRYFDATRGLETISEVTEDADGILWLATYSGLVRFDPATGESRLIGRRDGLPTDQVSTIMHDGLGRLWISTGKGVALYDPETGTLKSFDTRDGLPSNRSNRCGARTEDGHLLFGGEAGLITFDPGEFVNADFRPEVVLTDIRLMGESLGVGGDSPLTALPHRTTHFTLDYGRNDLTFVFAALDYGRPRQNRYRFRLDGQDDDWRVPTALPQATYTNLAPGEYVFRVMGSNRDGLWSDREAVVSFDILPPWWRTGWATAAYFLGALLLAWIVFRQLTMRERMRARLDLQRAEAAHLQQMDELKTRFLTNITHEFRTPLTLIKVPLLQLRESGQDAEVTADRVESMLRNTERLEQLIDQLLDLSRLEAGRLPLHWEHGDCLEFVGRYATSFESLAARREVAYVIDAADGACAAWYDQDVIEKLLGNLITNAFKHTPARGRITVAVTAGAEQTAVPPGGERADPGPLPARTLRLAVTNTGSFIAPDERRSIFDRFHQASVGAGSGVGLALVRELAEWLGGQVAVDSDPETGTRFTVDVPVFLVDPLQPDGAAPAPVAAGQAAEEDEDEPDDAGGRPRILIVDDNADMRELMASYLAEDYVVMAAAGGEEGLETAIAEIPDLVLSDVMMDGMDGFGLCRRLKEDERTSHVPVILLTALAEARHRHEGLKQGADDYLAKPFDAKDLRIRIQNLIEQRRKLAERYERSLAVLAPEAVMVTSADERFIAQVRAVIDANLDDPDFKITELCRDVGMSRAQLHRKLRAVTGKSTTEFVRTHRLQRAAQLFDGGYGNVTEVAFTVGFRNLSYFARSFRELFGEQPRGYLKKRGAAADADPDHAEPDEADPNDDDGDDEDDGWDDGDGEDED